MGTTDVPAIVRRIEEGDKHAGLVLDAMIYQIAKSIGAASVVLYGKIDAILLTGGMAHSDYIISRLKERISFLAPVHVYPGEDEMEACGAREVELDNEINSPEVYNDPDLLRQKSDELSDLRFHQEELFAAWEKAMEEQEQYEQAADEE